MENSNLLDNVFAATLWLWIVHNVPFCVCELLSAYQNVVGRVRESLKHTLAIGEYLLPDRSKVDARSDTMHPISWTDEGRSRHICVLLHLVPLGHDDHDHPVTVKSPIGHVRLLGGSSGPALVFAKRCVEQSSQISRSLCWRISVFDTQGWHAPTLMSESMNSSTRSNTNAVF